MAANLLWAHLLRKDATTSDSPLQIPPVAIAPQDKTGTSMRMLIHDTQANLEKFSTRLDGLLQRVDECRAQVVNANKLLDVERDRVLTEILEIAKRYQSELKTHIGTPAQATALELVRVSQVSTEHSTQALEKRIDALQTVLQTHTHAMQSIQAQQNTLIGTILPLVPLIHSVPPQIGHIKAALSDMVANAVSTMTTRIENMESKLVAECSRGRAEADSPAQVGSSDQPVSRRKRSNALIHGPEEIKVPFSSPLDGRGHRRLYRGLKRTRVEGTAQSVENAELSRPAVPSTDPSNLPLLWRSQTPRRPLADLPLPPWSSPQRTQHPMAGRGYMRPFEGGPSSMTTPKLRTPFRCLPHLRRSVPLHGDPLDVNKSATGLPTAPGPSTQDTLSKAIRIEEHLEPMYSGGVISVHSSPLSSPPASAPRRDPNEASAIDCPRPPENMLGEGEFVEIPPSLSAPAPSKPDVSALQPMSLRDRRAQISMFRRAETRRFLPLVPWSDDEE